MAKDRMGNKLEPGDKVVLSLDNQLTIGVVEEVKEPVITGPKNQRGPALLRLTVGVTIPYNPKDAIVAIVKVATPPEEEPLVIQPN